MRNKIYLNISVQISDSDSLFRRNPDEKAMIMPVMDSVGVWKNMAVNTVDRDITATIMMVVITLIHRRYLRNIETFSSTVDRISLS